MQEMQSAAMSSSPKRWSRIARRIRVPLGFLLAIFYLWLSRPTWPSLAAGAIIAAPGLILRAIASGYVKKDRELTTTGPYAYTRNPLYLGSVMAAAGFALAARNIWIALAMLVMFLAIYVPVIRDEEEFLSKTFADFETYRQNVPRLLPSVRRFQYPGARADETEAEQTQVISEGFSRDLYLRHREYNAVIGALVLLAALAA